MCVQFSRRRRRLATALCALLTLLGDGALASDGQDTLLEPVEVEAEPELPESAAASSSLDFSSAHRFGRALAEVLTRVPGLYVRRAGGSLQPSRVQLRGASSEQVLVLLDGLRLNSLSNASFDLSLLPLFALESATVLRGSGALAAGSGAQGGVIELHSRSAEGGDALTMRLGGGSFGSFGTELAGALTGSSWRLRMGLGLEQSEGDFDFVDQHGEQQQRRNNDALQLGAFASGQLDWAAWQLGWVGLGSWTERGAPGPSEFPERFSDARSEETQLLNGLRLAPKSALGLWGGLLDGELRLGYRFSQSSYQNPRALLGATGFFASALEQSFEPSLKLDFISGRSLSTLFVQSRHEFLERDMGSTPEPFSRHGLALGLLEELSFFDDEVLRLSLGLRLDASSDGELVWIPRAAALLQPWPWVSMQLELDRAFRRPAFDELYLRTEFLRGSPELQPEHAFRASGMLRVQAHRRLELELGVYLHDYDELIQFVPANALFYQARNLRGASSRGLELELGWRPVDALSARVAYAYNLAELQTQPRYPLPGRPRHLLGGVLELLLDELLAEVEARYVSERALDSFGRRQAAAALWLDARLSFCFAPAWSVALSANNLLDVRDAVDALQYPLPARAFFASLSFRLGENEP